MRREKCEREEERREEERRERERVVCRKKGGVADSKKMKINYA